MPRGARAARRAHERNPIGGLPLLPIQDEFHRDPSKRKSIRTGNQLLGKTTIGLIECICHCLGDHPHYDVPPPPVHGGIVCVTHKQSIIIQEKLWNLLPKDQIYPETEYVPGIGFRGQFKLVRFLNGSTIEIVTAGQDGISLESRTWDFAHIDEPPKNPIVYSTITKRVAGTNGWVWITFTPMHSPTKYLREFVDSGAISEHWTPMTPAALIPVGHTVPRMLKDGITPADAEYIRFLRTDTLPHLIPPTIDGHWDMRVVNQLFRAFRASGPRTHVHDGTPPGEFQLRLGIDHGDGTNFSSTAGLVGSYTDEYGVESVWVLDEYVSEGETDEKDDARQIVNMLVRWSWTWEDLHQARGDRPWVSAPRNKRKDNVLLAAAIRAELHARFGRSLELPLDPPILLAKTGDGSSKGSVGDGHGYLHRKMVRDGLYNVQSRCTHGVEAHQAFDGRPDSEWKHWFDWLRYALSDLIIKAAQVRAVELQVR